MFKSLFAVAAALVCMTGDVTVQKASAASRCQTTSTNYEVCTTDNGDYGADYVSVFKPSGVKVTSLKVICTGNGGNRWESYGSWTKSDNQDLATWWCKSY